MRVRVGAGGAQMAAVALTAGEPGAGVFAQQRLGQGLGQAELAAAGGAGEQQRMGQTALSVLLQQPLHLFPVPGTGHLDGGVQRHCSIS